MAEQVSHSSPVAQQLQANIGLKKSTTVPDFVNGSNKAAIQSAIMRERSFIRPNNQQHQMNNKRRSLAFNHQLHQMHQQPHHVKGKPAMEIYRPPNVRVDLQHPNKLNVHAQEFQMSREFLNSRSSLGFFPTSASLLQHSKSSGNMQQQLQQLAAVRQHGLRVVNVPSGGGGTRQMLVAQPLQLGQLGVGMPMISSQMPLVTSPSSGNILHASTPRVKFAPDPTSSKQQPTKTSAANSLQRSKSLSSADTLARGIAGLGLGLGKDGSDMGEFNSEIQALIDQAVLNPNQLNARALMELANATMNRAVEGRRYALPTSRFCISVIAKEHKETFLEALLNTCRQWYQEREKVLGPAQTIKTTARPRFTAFMAFLTEMFCQLKRRQLQLRTKCDGAPPPLVLLTLLSKCCEDCVRPPVRSLSEIECLFFVLTCIGRDLETHLPQQLEMLLASVRDAFLNSSASAPAIRRTLLQLIELQASRWQLPGNTVLYYYPSSK